MRWTTEEIENLTLMLFSADERNQLLALELIQTKPHADDFTAALVFLKNVVYNDDLVEIISQIIEKQCVGTTVDYWNDALYLVRFYWEVDKKAFLSRLETFEKEAERIESYLLLAPQYSYFYGDIGRMLVRYKNYQKGLTYFEKATIFDPNSYNAHFDYAYHLKESHKNADTIIEHYKRCIEINANNYVAYHNLGRVYANQKANFKKAAEVLRKGLANNPTFTDSMIELALVEEELGNIGEARTLLESALQLDDNSDLAHNNFAFMLWNYFKEYEKAKEHIQKALKLAPKIALYWHTLAEVEWYGFQDKEKAVAALEQSLKVQKSYKGAKKMLEEIS